MVGIIGSFHPGVIMAVGTLSARPENRAVGMGLFYSIYYAGGTVVPAFCGWAADHGRRTGRRAAGRSRHLGTGDTDVYAAPPAGVARAHAGAGVKGCR